MVVMMRPNYNGTIMELQFYRLHRKECEAGRQQDFKSGPLEEGRRGWKKCSCLIHTSGSIAGKFGRRSTGERDWENAHAVAFGWVNAGSWAADESRAAPEPVPDPDSLPTRTAIGERLEAYMNAGTN